MTPSSLNRSSLSQSSPSRAGRRYDGLGMIGAYLMLAFVAAIVCGAFNAPGL